MVVSAKILMDNVIAVSCGIKISPVVSLD